MYRVIIFFLALLIFSTARSAYTQLLIDDGYYFGGINPDDLVITIPEGDSIEENISIEDVVEAVGTVTSSSPIYSKPSKNGSGSKIIRNASYGEKILITGNDDDWYAIRMYNGKSGYVEKRYVKTVKIFYDESVAENSMDKRLDYEIRDLVKRFNSMISKSTYLKQNRIAPMLNVISTSKRSNKMIVTLEYSAINQNGVITPSKIKNDLDSDMRDFIDLLFLKMITVKALSYKIIIKSPNFSKDGKVLNMQRNYAELDLDYKDINPDKIKGYNSSVYNIIEADMDKEKLFDRFPY